MNFVGKFSVIYDPPKLMIQKMLSLTYIQYILKLLFTALLTKNVLEHDCVLGRKLRGTT
ncbi:hypothetical protein GCM10019994_01820 [Enterococcus raffinosus]|nr:hypothetical protein NUITMVRE36_13280 [Enterococcus raffinosus]